MSKELEIPVLAMSQLSRKVEDRPMAIPPVGPPQSRNQMPPDDDLPWE